MKAPERAERDQNALRLWVAGATFPQIATAVGLSVRQVERVVKKELAAGAARRSMLTDAALELHQERTERLFQAYWGPALKGDHKAADICRKMLADNARLNNLYADALPSLPAPTSTSGVVADEDEEPADDLARIRARRSSAG